MRKVRGASTSRDCGGRASDRCRHGRRARAGNGLNPRAPTPGRIHSCESAACQGRCPHLICGCHSVGRRVPDPLRSSAPRAMISKHGGMLPKASVAGEWRAMRKTPPPVDRCFVARSADLRSWTSTALLGNRGLRAAFFWATAVAAAMSFSSVPAVAASHGQSVAIVKAGHAATAANAQAKKKRRRMHIALPYDPVALATAKAAGRASAQPHSGRAANGSTCGCRRRMAWTK